VDTTESSARSSSAHPEVAAGDPFIAAGSGADRDRGGDCPSCFGGYVTITYEDADGSGAEVFEPVPCRRCQASPSETS
jgi:hypothetical protein